MIFVIMIDQLPLSVLGNRSGWTAFWSKRLETRADGQGHLMRPSGATLTAGWPASRLLEQHQPLCGEELGATMAAWLCPPPIWQQNLPAMVKQSQDAGQSAVAGNGVSPNLRRALYRKPSKQVFAGVMKSMMSG